MWKYIQKGRELLSMQVRNSILYFTLSVEHVTGIVRWTTVVFCALDASMLPTTLITMSVSSSHSSLVDVVTVETLKPGGLV
jgi:hypothetical protein